MLNEHGSVAFYSTLNIPRNAPVLGYNLGIWSNAGGTLRELVPFSAPSAVQEDFTFQKFVLPDTGRLIFTATEPHDAVSAWVASSPALRLPIVAPGSDVSLDFLESTPTAEIQTRSFDMATGAVVYQPTL